MRKHYRIRRFGRGARTHRWVRSRTTIARRTADEGDNILKYLRFVPGAALVVGAVTLAGCGRNPAAPAEAAPPAASVVADQAADAIYTGGDIVTMNDAQPTAEAVAVKDGSILAVGGRSDIERARRGTPTQFVGLGGRTLVPGFIDEHAHFRGFGSQAVGANLLAPPDGTVNTIHDVVAGLQEFANGPDVGRTGWIFGLGDDDALLGRHPTRDDLDKVSKDVPVIAVHISGHFSAMNSAGLAKVGIAAATKDPEGGVIRRRPGGTEPNGVLEELASIPYMIPAISAISAINASKPEGKDYFVKKGLELAKSFGYTTAVEGRAMAFQREDLLDFAKRGLLDIDIISLMDYTAKDVIPSPVTTKYDGRHRVGALEITLDGSPQGRTAWRTIPYLIPPDGQKAGYKGYPAIPDTKLVEALLDEAYRKGWPTHVHANGDAAVDQFTAALKPVHPKHGPGDRRFTLIHGQFVRRGDQLDQRKELGVIASLFPMHTFYWGDGYDQIVGPELAQQISPIKTALDKGLHVNSHTDAPVALPNLMQVMRATVNRASRSGKVMGADERLTPEEGVKAIKIWPAYAIFEEKSKGSIEPGKLADLVVPDGNPLKVDPSSINQIVVVETIKEGKSVYRRDEAPTCGTSGGGDGDRSDRRRCSPRQRSTGGHVEPVARIAASALMPCAGTASGQESSLQDVGSMVSATSALAATGVPRSPMESLPGLRRHPIDRLSWCGVRRTGASDGAAMTTQERAWTSPSRR